MSKKKTQEEFINELKQKNPTIKCIDTYKTMHTKIKFKCSVCKYEWYDSPAHILNGRGCHQCNKKIRRTHEDFLKEVGLKFKHIEIRSIFKGVDSPISCYCKIHNRLWDTTPFTLLSSKYGCKLCANEASSKKQRKSITTFKNEVNTLTKGEYSIVGEYVNTRTPITFIHNTCKNTFNMRPDNFLMGERCPHCILPTKGEQKIINYLDYVGKEYIFQKYYNELVGINGGLLSYDFYLPNYNLLIEYQGEFHDGTANVESLDTYHRQQEHDRRKRQYAKDHDIKLLEIWYWDFENIEEILSRELGLVA